MQIKIQESGNANQNTTRNRECESEEMILCCFELTTFFIFEFARFFVLTMVIFS